MTKKFDIEKTQKVVFIDSDKNELTININTIEKLESIINIYSLLGHVGEENCSGADVGIEFRSIPNECRKKRRICCNL